MTRTNLKAVGACAGLVALLVSGSRPATAQAAPPLGVLQQFSVLGNSAVTGSTGAGTVVDGDVGSSPTASISNFPPSSVTPFVHFALDCRLVGDGQALVGLKRPLATHPRPRLLCRGLFRS